MQSGALLAFVPSVTYQKEMPLPKITYVSQASYLNHYRNTKIKVLNCQANL